VSRGDRVNEHVYDMIDNVEGVNLAMESHFDYGTRAGYWRIVRVLERYGATCTVNACAEALALSPWIARDAVARGFEISSHGYRWLSPKTMDEAEERDWIASAVKTIAGVAGVRPVGWHTRCPHTRTHGACLSRRADSSTTATRTTTTWSTEVEAHPRIRAELGHDMAPRGGGDRFIASDASRDSERRFTSSGKVVTSPKRCGRPEPSRVSGLPAQRSCASTSRGTRSSSYASLS